jgi:hypothetical protein
MVRHLGDSQGVKARLMVETMVVMVAIILCMGKEVFPVAMEALAASESIPMYILKDGIYLILLCATQD